MTDSREKAYLEAYEAYAGALFRHASFRISNRERALDLTQDTFLKTWDFVQKGGEIEEYKSFLYRTLNNLIIDEYRKKKSLSLDEILEGDTGEMEAKLSEGSVRDIEEDMDSEAVQDRIRTKIQDLPESYREVVTLRYVDGLTPKEIALLLKTNENAVSVRIHRGVARLRDLCRDDPQLHESTL